MKEIRRKCNLRKQLHSKGRWRERDKERQGERERERNNDKSEKGVRYEQEKHGGEKKIMCRCLDLNYTPSFMEPSHTVTINSNCKKE